MDDDMDSGWDDDGFSGDFNEDPADPDEDTPENSDDDNSDADPNEPADDTEAAPHINPECGSNDGLNTFGWFPLMYLLSSAMNTQQNITDNRRVIPAGRTLSGPELKLFSSRDACKDDQYKTYLYRKSGDPPPGNSYAGNGRIRKPAETDLSPVEEVKISLECLLFFMIIIAFLVILTIFLK